MHFRPLAQLSACRSDFGLSLKKMMERQYNPAGGNGIAGTGAALVVLLLAACNAVWNAPEGHASDFIQTLVTTPAATQELREFANIAPDRNPEDLLDGLSARVAVDFLRAKEAQGASLDFSRGQVQRLDAARRVVEVHVGYAPAEGGERNQIQFQVLMEKDDQGRWRIDRITGGD